MKRFVIMGLAVCAVIAGAISYYASSRPDGLERVAEVLAGDQSAGADATSRGAAPMPDYKVPGVHSKRMAGGLAGVAGVAVTFIICVSVGKLVSRRRNPSAGHDGKD